MSNNIEVKSTVTRPDGKVYAKYQYYWEDCPPEMIAWMDAELVKANTNAIKLSQGKKEDDGSFSAVLEATVGDNTYPETVLHDLTYNMIVKQEQYWHKVSGDLLKIAEDIAKNKAKAYKKA